MTSELLVPKAAWHSYPMLGKDIQTYERDTGQGGDRFSLDAPASCLERTSWSQVQQQRPTLSSRSQGRINLESETDVLQIIRWEKVRKDFYRQHAFSSLTHLVTVQILQRQSVTGHLERKAVINSQRTDAQKTSHQQNTSIVATALERPETRAPS